MPAAIDSQPLWLQVQFHRVAVEMVIGRNKIHIFVREQKIDHAPKLIWKMEIVILREIHYFRILLGNKNIELLTKVASLPLPSRLTKSVPQDRRNIFEETRKFRRTTVQRNQTLTRNPASDALKDLRQTSESRSLSSLKGRGKASSATFG